MRLVVSSSSYSSILGSTKSQKVKHILLEAVVGFVLAAADAEGMGGQARAAILLEDLQDLFAVAEAVEQRRQRADIQRVRAQPNLVAGQPVQLGQNDAQVTGALGGASASSSFSTASQ